MDYSDIRQRLLNHLPRVILDGPVAVSADRLTIDERGVSIGDLADMLRDLSGHAAFLPEGMPLRNITLRDLELERQPDDEDGFSLSFTVDWGRTEISVADDFPLHLAAARFDWSGGRLVAELDVELHIAGMQLEARLSLPSQIVSLELGPAEADKAAPFLAKSGLVQQGGNQKLERLSVAGSILYRHFTLRVEIKDLFDLGPVRLTHADAELVLGRSAADLSFEASAELEIEVSDRTTLTLRADGQLDDHGWRVAGALDLSGQGHTIGDLVARATPVGQTPPALPSVIADLALTRLAAEIDTHAGLCALDCALDWQSDDAGLVIHVEKRGKSLQLSGTLTIGEAVFRMVFDKSAQAILVASYEAAGSRGLTLDDMLAVAGIDAHAAFGEGGTGIDINAKAVGIAIEGKGKMLLAAEVEAGVNLSSLGDLPVLGSLLPEAGRIGLALKPYYRSKSFRDEDRAKALLPNALGLGDGALKSGFNLSASLELGAFSQDLPDVTLSSPQDMAPPEQAKAGSAVHQGSAQPPRAGLDWTDVHHSVGPLTIARVGWALSDDKSRIDIAFDGALSVAGLNLSLSGLGARYSFADQVVSPHLQGLGLDFRKGPLTIGGAFLNLDGDFAGKVLIGTKQFSLSALGAFTMLEGAPSMFAFGVLGMPLGGPVFFFVEGLAAGFGVHRRLHPPKIEDVRDFPLIAAANATSVGAEPDPDPTAQLRAISTYITPELGQYFFAAGIKFNSFRLLHGTLLAVVSFGRDFEVDVIGTADFTTPPDLPAGVPALARVELDLIARVVPDEGIVSVEARLNPKSYVYSPLCHLSGGFAYRAWFKGDHAGDFVLSVGGYAPQFKKPPHYPDVPRVTLKYQISEGVFVKGDGYFAMTPSAMMAGGGLHMNVEIDSLHAWADFTVDMIVRWEPFHYDAWMHIGIGAKWKCFETSASADLHIWGPQFSGVAHVEWCVFSFDVNFGPRQAHLPVPISFDRFKAAFLGWDKTQESLDTTLGLAIAEGTIGHIGDVPVVAGSQLTIVTSSKVPLTRALLGGADAGVAAPGGLGIAPTGGKPLGDALHEIKITRDGAAGAEKAFVIDTTPLTSGVPAALWGLSFDAQENAPPIKAATGVTLRPVVTLLESKSKPMSAASFWLAQPKPVIRAPVARRMLGFVAPAAPQPAVSQSLRLVLVRHGGRKIPVIKEVRSITGLGLKPAKDLTEQGGTLRENLTPAQAENFVAELEALGAVVRLEPMTTAAAPAPGAGPTGPFRLVLRKTGRDTIAVIKLVRNLSGLGLKEVKERVHSGDFEMEDLTLTEANAHKQAFEEVGAQVELIPMTDAVQEDVQLPDDLPLGDLRQLGLDPDDLVVAPLRNTRQTITLRPEGFAIA